MEFPSSSEMIAPALLLALASSAALTATPGNIAPAAAALTLPILWPEQYTVHKQTTVIRLTHMRSCTGRPPVCHNATNPETFQSEHD